MCAQIRILNWSVSGFKTEKSKKYHKCTFTIHFKGQNGLSIDSSLQGQSSQRSSKFLRTRFLQLYGWSGLVSVLQRFTRCERSITRHTNRAVKSSRDKTKNSSLKINILEFMKMMIKSKTSITSGLLMKFLRVFQNKLMVFQSWTIMNWVFCIKYLDKSSHDVS